MREFVEKLARMSIEGNYNTLVPWYLMTCHLYYHKDESVISDGLFDELCKLLLEQWDTIKHPHKYLIDKDALLAGTGHGLKEEALPGIVKGAAERLLSLK